MSFVTFTSNLNAAYPCGLGPIAYSQTQAVLTGIIQNNHIISNIYRTPSPKDPLLAYFTDHSTGENGPSLPRDPLLLGGAILLFAATASFLFWMLAKTTPAEPGNDGKKTSESECLKFIHKYHPDLKVAMDRVGWTIEQQDGLVACLDNSRLHPLSDYFTDVCTGLVAAVEALEATPWTPDEKLRLLTAVAKKSGKQEAGRSFKKLSPALLGRRHDVWRTYCRGLKDTGWSSERQLRALLDFVENQHDGSKLPQALSALPVAFQAMASAKWNDDQKLTLMMALRSLSEPKADDLYGTVRLFEIFSWNSEQRFQLLMSVAHNHKDRDRPDWPYASLRDLVVFLQKRGFKEGPILDYVLPFIQKSKEELGAAVDAFHLVVDNVPASETPRVMRRFLNLLDGLTDYNRKSILDLLARNGAAARLGPEHFPGHFELYVSALERWPRLGFNILEGLVEAATARDAKELDPDERRTIESFIEKTNGFIPALYEAYLKEGDGLFARLGKDAEAILKDEFGMEDARRVIEKDGEEFLLALIQKASPTSGSSFVPKTDQLGLLRETLAEGDLRSHIPKTWRGKIESFSLPQGAYRLAEGKTADPQGEIRRLLDHFRTDEKHDKPTEPHLVQALEVYVRSDRGPEARAQVRHRLYALAGRNEALRAKIDRIQSPDYVALTLLGQIFDDKEDLSSILAEALERVPEKLLAGKGDKKSLPGDLEGFVKSLKKEWGRKRSPARTRLPVMAKMLTPYDIDDVGSRLLSREGLETDLKEAITQAMTRSPDLDRKDLMDEILSEPRESIRLEKAKYEYGEAGRVSVQMRAVKGPPYGLSGLTCGVCTAADIDHWKDPRFKLLAIQDADAKTVVGHIYVYEIEIGKKKYMTLPGINPSTEFLGTVDGKAFYDLTMDKMILFAKAGGYDGVCIPTAPNIHSNRTSIQKAIRESGYAVRRIPKVEWNRLPKPYPFDEVYVAWEKK